MLKEFTEASVKSIKIMSVLFCLAAPLLSAAQLNKLVSSIYYIQTIDIDQECEIKKTLFGISGQPLFKICKQNYNNCVIEGTCALADEDVELLNFVKSDKNGVPLFETVDTSRCPYGLGVSNICLDPYYSVAADLNYYKAGDVIFIPKLRGLALLSGEKHPGYLIVRDRGGAIKGATRFDFYTGFNHFAKDPNPFNEFGLSQSKNMFEFRRATEAEANEFKKSRNFPNVPESEMKK